MMKRFMLMSTALMFSVGIASAAITANDLVTTFQGLGYTSIQVETGLTQFKVEAVLGTTKLEAIYDAATGIILKQETSTAEPGDTSTGVELSTTTHDFLDGTSDGDEGDVAGVDNSDDNTDSGGDVGDDNGGTGDTGSDDGGDGGTSGGDGGGTGGSDD